LRATPGLSCTPVSRRQVKPGASGAALTASFGPEDPTG
jgi:hypothetical protein